MILAAIVLLTVAAYLTGVAHAHSLGLDRAPYYYPGKTDSRRTHR